MTNNTAVSDASDLVVITGASGFIGRALVARLRGMDSMYISCLGRATPSFDGVACYAYGADLEIGAALKETIAEAPEDARLTVVHLAGAAHDPSMPDSAREAAIDQITDALALALKGHRVLRLINLSSIAARDGQHLPAKRLAGFGRAKARSEDRLAEVVEAQGGQVISLRPPAIWGPGAPGSLATVRRLVQKPFPLPISGVRVPRAYLHIDRLTDVISQLIIAQWPPSAQMCFEVADPAPYTIGEIFAAVAAEENQALHTLRLPSGLLRWLLIAIGKAGLVDQVFTPLDVSSKAFNTFLSKLEREP